MKNKKIKYGETDLVPADIKRSDESIRISMMVEGDFLDQIKMKAAETGMAYQTYMKFAIRRFMTGGEVSVLEARIQKVERDLAYLDRRTSATEKKSKKRA